MWKRWRIRILLFLAVLGPGFITANVDNDSGGILTYSQAGAQYGYSLLWTMIPITIALIVVQEMCARMGVVTGKGLSDLIREEFGLRLTFVLMVLLVVVNYTNVVTEFIGIAGSLHLFHVTKFISVPLCAALVWFMVVKGSYKSTEKIFLVASVVYIAYIFAGVLSQPSWHEALQATVQLPEKSVWRDKAYIYMAIGIVGTTIAPWMQFYLQSSVVEKGIRVKDYAASRLDVIVGQLLHRYCGVVHHRGLRGDAVCTRDGSDPGGGGRGGSDAAAGRRLCVHPVRVRAVQRVAVCGFDSAVCRRRTRCAKAWDSSRAWTRALRRRRLSTGFTRC